MPINATFEPQSNGEVYSPSSDFLAKTNASALESMALRAEEDLSGFWAERALELEWYQPWNKVLDDSNKPFYKWFVGGKVNIVHNCLDRLAGSLSNLYMDVSSIPTPRLQLPLTEDG